MSKALIAGGAGFLGAHLAAELLALGWRVDLLDNFSRGSRDGDLQSLCDRGAVLRNADLLREDGLAGLPQDYSHVFHFAAIVGVGNVLERPFAVLHENVRMLESVLLFCRSLGEIERIVFASTSEVYAGTLQHFTLPIPTPEATPLAITDVAHPRASYMLSKIYGEALCHQSGTPFTIVRPHNIYGPRMGMSHVIPELLKKAQLAAENGELPVYSAAHRRSFCYVSDAVRMIRLAAASDACRGQTLNVGNQATEISMGELAGLIAGIVGKNLRVAALAETPGSPARRCPDMAKTGRLTGYSARVGLDEGIRLTYDWYRPLLVA